MTIEKLKQKKIELEAKLDGLLHGFEEETGMRINGVHYKRYEVRNHCGKVIESRVESKIILESI